MQIVQIKHLISSFRKMLLGTLRWLLFDPSRTCLGLMGVTTTQQSITAMQIQACNEFVLFSLLVCHGAVLGGGSHSPQLQQASLSGVHYITFIHSRYRVQLQIHSKTEPFEVLETNDIMFHGYLIACSRAVLSEGHCLSGRTVGVKHSAVGESNIYWHLQVVIYFQWEKVGKLCLPSGFSYHTLCKETLQCLSSIQCQLHSFHCVIWAL